jgi:hypothetical protein
VVSIITAMLEQVHAFNVMLASLHLYQVRQCASCVHQDIRALPVGIKRFVQLELILLAIVQFAIHVGMENIAQLQGVVCALHVLLAWLHREAMFIPCSHHRQPRAVCVLWGIIVMVFQL